MKHFKDFITEGRDAPLYHATPYPMLARILTTDKLDDDTPQEIRGKEVQGVSLTRDKNFAKNFGNWAVIELDQRKLSQRYKIIPHDYFQTNYGYQPDDYSPQKRRKKDFAEAEEFVIGPIPKLHKYITAIYLKSPTKMFGNWEDIFDFKTFKDL